VALESHIATLKGNIAKAEALIEQQHREVEAARKRLDEMVAELVAMSKMMAGQSAAIDSARAELAAYQSRAWWKWIASWLELSPVPSLRPGARY
jgi:flagellar biosynthesis chaperone FliJ